jgi:hypothetical protein
VGNMMNNDTENEKYQASKQRFIGRYLELKELNDTKKMEIVKSNFQRIFGYSIFLEV